ncbi:MAG: hypothetical protein V2I39_12605 [Erythrobacter sp.]|jgi:hypothetical protein|nr:hypothetical protein [Erythrobacter sp.]
MKKPALISAALALGTLALAGCQEPQGQHADVELEEEPGTPGDDGAIDGIAEPNTPNEAIADETAGSVGNELADEDEAGLAEERLAE